MPDQAAAHAATPAEAPPPRDFKGLRALIVARRGALPRRLLQIADFALAHPEEIAFGRVADVAKQSGVQPSALIRFAQALGYAGFSDIQAVCRAHARASWPDYRERLASLRTGETEIGAAGQPAALLRQFARAASLSIERLSETIDDAALERVVDLLARAGIIYLVGARRSFPVVCYLAYAMRKLGLRCELVDQVGDLAAEQVALIAPADAVLAVSFTPYAQSSVELTATARRRDVPVALITNSPFSPLVQSATAWLEVAEADHAAFRSLAATFTLATALAVAVAERRGTANDVPADTE